MNCTSGRQIHTNHSYMAIPDLFPLAAFPRSSSTLPRSSPVISINLLRHPSEILLHIRIPTRGLRIHNLPSNPLLARLVRPGLDAGVDRSRVRRDRRFARFLRVGVTRGVVGAESFGRSVLFLELIAGGLATSSSRKGCLATLLSCTNKQELVSGGNVRGLGVRHWTIDWFG